MYKDYFGLRINPFNVNPDPRFLYLARHTREALACLSYGIQKRKGFLLLTGEVGTGKTTLLNKLLDWLRTYNVPTAYLFNPRFTVQEFFDYVMCDFGVSCPSRDKSQVLLRLNQWLLEKYRSGSTAVLIIDEAQNLSYELLEEVRLLTNLETSTEKLLQIVLSGQPELDEKLRQPQLRQLQQRITLRCRTCPLTPEETAAYIAQRLLVAGANGTPIFTAEAIEQIHKHTRGIPRVTNLVCEHALINAFVDQKKPVSGDVIETVVQDLELNDNFLQPASQAGDPDPQNLVDAVKLLSHIRNSIRRLETISETHKEKTE